MPTYKGIEEDTCDEIDIVNNNNGFYKTYVQYLKSGKSDDEVFEVYLSKMNADNNEIGALCILLNIFNDNNLQNKGKTNNITNCYLRLMSDEEELCRFKVEDINSDKKTTALVLGVFKRLDNGCWCLWCNDVPLKKGSKLDSYEEYAKKVVLGTYSNSANAPKGSCCVIL